MEKQGGPEYAGKTKGHQCTEREEGAGLQRSLRAKGVTLPPAQAPCGQPSLVAFSPCPLSNSNSKPGPFGMFCLVSYLALHENK